MILKLSEKAASVLAEKNSLDPDNTALMQYGLFIILSIICNYLYHLLRRFRRYNARRHFLFGLQLSQKLCGRLPCFNRGKVHRIFFSGNTRLRLLHVSLRKV